MARLDSFVAVHFDTASFIGAIVKRSHSLNILGTSNRHRVYPRDKRLYLVIHGMMINHVPAVNFPAPVVTVARRLREYLDARRQVVSLKEKTKNKPKFNH